MSSKSTGGLCGIEHLALLVDRLEKVGIANGAGHHQIDRASEKPLQFFFEIEVTMERASRGCRQKLQEEIQVALNRIKAPVRRRPEHFQRLHVVLAAQCL